MSIYSCHGEIILSLPPEVMEEVENIITGYITANFVNEPMLRELETFVNNIRSERQHVLADKAPRKPFTIYCGCANDMCTSRHEPARDTANMDLIG